MVIKMMMRLKIMMMGVVDNVVENVVGDALLIFLVIMLSKLTCL